MELEATPATEAESSFTEDQAASALLKKWGATDEPQEPTEEQESEVEQADEATADTEEESSEPDESESGSEEIDVLGEKFKFSKADAETAKRLTSKFKELETGANRKFEEAASIRKAAEQAQANVQQLNQFVQANADLLADHRMVMKRLQAFESINAAQLQQEDPALLARLATEGQQLAQAKQRIEAQYQQNLTQMAETTKKAQQERFQEFDRFAKTNIKGWSDEYSKTLAEFAVKDLGYSPDQLTGTMSEALIKTLDLAYQGHKVKTSKPLDKRLNESKTLKPSGSGQPKGQAAVKAEQSFIKAKRSGSIDDAALALLARSNTRKK